MQLPGRALCAVCSMTVPVKNPRVIKGKEMKNKRGLQITMDAKEGKRGSGEGEVANYVLELVPSRELTPRIEKGFH